MKESNEWKTFHGFWSASSRYVQLYDPLTIDIRFSGPRPMFHMLVSSGPSIFTGSCVVNVIDIIE